MRPAAPPAPEEGARRLHRRHPGAGLVELQQAGDWRSPSMPAHYARAQLAARGAVAKLRYGASDD